MRLQRGEIACIQEINVLPDLSHNLLGHPAITALKLIARVNSVHVDTIPKNITRQYPKLFTGLGTLEGDFEIHLKPDAKPYCLYTPRKVPFSLQDKVKEELTQMESLGVISKVEEPTSWCAGMVVVPKKSGDVTGFVLTSNHSIRMFLEKFTPSTWAAEKFADYSIGKLFHIETDHKPLVPILSSQHFDQFPSRVLGFRLPDSNLLCHMCQERSCTRLMPFQEHH